jgi:3,4-dihydroxy-2-butanone 4-phosphate synthase
MFEQLKAGELVILYDDVETKVGALVGIAEAVSPHTVNQMTKIGKGLVYVCITEEKAQQLELPLMSNDNHYISHKPLTVSVDFMSTTTGISAFERSDTIKAFTDENTRAGDFRRPGHVFPLLSKDNGLLQRTGMAEAATDLAKLASAAPAAYMCEILNQAGDIASKQEIVQIAEAHSLSLILLSELIELSKNEVLGSFQGLVIKGREVGRKLGFPTANLCPDWDNPLDFGVYGVTVDLNGAKYFGVMNVGVRPTFNNENQDIHHEVHLLGFSGTIYNEILKIDVNFFVRNEKSFSTVDQLIFQIKRDIQYVEKRFRLVSNNTLTG